MKIKQIYIENIQTVLDEPLIIEFNPKLTRISGPNASGKSVVAKSLNLFSGIYTMPEIKGLIPKNLAGTAVSKVGILLETNESVWCIINRSGNKLIYQHLSKDGNIVGAWSGFSEQIPRILGWRVIDRENINLNIKTNKQNLFIDTKATTNAEIIEYICRDQDIEVRLDNIKQARKEMELAIKDLFYKKSCNLDILETMPDIDEDLLNSYLEDVRELFKKYTTIYRCLSASLNIDDNLIISSLLTKIERIQAINLLAISLLYNNLEGFLLKYINSLENQQKSNFAADLFITNNLVEEYKSLLRISSFKESVETTKDIEICTDILKLKNILILNILKESISCPTKEIDFLLTQYLRLHFIKCMKKHMVINKVTDLMGKQNIIYMAQIVEAENNEISELNKSLEGKVCPLCKRVM